MKPSWRTLCGWSLFAFLVLRADGPVLSYWMGTSGAFDAGSLRGILYYGLLPTLTACAAAAAAWGAGERILAALSIPKGLPERGPLGFALGAGLWAASLFFLGALGSLRPLPAALLAACFFTAAFPVLPRLGPAFRAWKAPSELFPRLLWVLVLYAGWNAAIQALAPAADYDALVSHLALSKLYVKHGGILEIPWLYMSHYPHLISLLYSQALLFRMENLAALGHLAAAAALIVAVWRVAREEFGERAAWLAAALLAAQPLSLEYAGAPRPELWWSLFHFLSFTAAWRWRQDRRDAYLVAAGCLGGLAAATKLWGAVGLLLLAAWVLSLKDAGTFARRFRAVCVLLGFGAVCVLPWWVKTWLGTGNPVWPYLTAAFGDRFGAAYLSTRLSISHAWPAWAWRQPAFFLRQGPHHILAPLLLAGAWIASRKDERWPPFLRAQFGMFAAYAALMLWNLNAWRYCIPWLPFLSLALAWACSRLLSRKGLPQAIAAGLIAVGLWPVLGVSQNNAMFAVLSLNSSARPGVPPRELYREKTISCYSFLRAVDRWNESAGRSAKVLLFHITRIYPLDADCVVGHPMAQGLIPYDDLPDSAALGAVLDRLGVTHVAVGSQPEDHFALSPRAIALMSGLLARRGRPVLREGSFQLFALAPEPARSL